MPVNLLWVRESALARECSQLSLTYKKVRVTQTRSGVLKGFLRCPREIPTKPTSSLPCNARPKNRMTYSTHSWWSIDIESMNFNQIIMQGPEYVFWMILKIYARVIEIFNSCLPCEFCWVTLMFLGRNQMSQLTSFLVDPCSWSHYKQVPHFDNSSLHFLTINRFNMSVNNICNSGRRYGAESKIDIGKTIETKLSEDITITPCDTKVWIKTIFMENMDDLLKQCTETFCNVYHDWNVGNNKEKYALLQIRWGEWISMSLVCGTKENHAMIPDPVSSRTNTTGNGFESAHVSCVIHALCMAFFQSASDIVKSVKPNNRQNPATPVLQNDSLDQVLMFPGACMYLICKKSCKDTKRLVHNWIMTNDMKQCHKKYGVLSPGTESLPTIPVRALNQYIVFLNRCIQESCMDMTLLR